MQQQQVQCGAMQGRCKCRARLIPAESIRGAPAGHERHPITVAVVNLQQGKHVQRTLPSRRTKWLRARCSIKQQQQQQEQQQQQQQQDQEQRQQQQQREAASGRTIHSGTL